MSAGMTIAVLGAGGTVGSRVVAEAVARGHRVLALSRKPTSEHPDVTPVPVDARDPDAVRAALADFGADTVVVSVRTDPVDEDFLLGTTRTVLDAAARLGARVLVIGGAGALRSPGAPGLLVADDPARVPPQWRPVAAAGVAQLQACRAHAHTDWVYLSPRPSSNPASAPPATGAAPTPCSPRPTAGPGSARRTWPWPPWTSWRTRATSGTSRSSTRRRGEGESLQTVATPHSAGSSTRLPG